MYVVVAFGVAVVVLAVTLPTLLCQPAVDSAMAGNGSARLAWLEKELATTNQSLAEAHGQWESCRKQLVGAGVLLMGGGPGSCRETCSPQPQTGCVWLG